MKEVSFYDRNLPNDPGLTVELSLKANYDTIATTVAAYLGIDPYYLQFYYYSRSVSLFLLFLSTTAHFILIDSTRALKAGDLEIDSWSHHYIIQDEVKVPRYMHAYIK